MPIIGFAGVSEDVAAYFKWSQTYPFYSGILIGSGATLIALHLWKTRDRWVQPIRKILDRWFMPMREPKLRRLFLAAPGSGKNAAALIRIQRTVEDGEGIVQTFLATPNHFDAARVYAAQLRLRRDRLKENDGDKAWVEAGAMGINGAWTQQEWDDAIREHFGDVRGDTVD